MEKNEKIIKLLDTKEKINNIDNKDFINSNEIDEIKKKILDEGIPEPFPKSQLENLNSEESPN